MARLNGRAELAVAPEPAQQVLAIHPVGSRRPGEPDRSAAGVSIDNTSACNYAVIMRQRRIVQIGKLRKADVIPKTLLEQTRLGEEVELQAVEGKIIILPAFPPRHDWDSVFSRWRSVVTMRSSMT